MNNLEKIAIDLTHTAELYNKATDEVSKKHYDSYAYLVINWEVPREHQDNYAAYWEGLKK